MSNGDRTFVLQNSIYNADSIPLIFAMIATPNATYLTPQEYFDWEAQQPSRYEYFDGTVYAMAGGTLAHADIALNIATALKPQLPPGCKVRNSDARIGITEQGPFTYPDVSVSCNVSDRDALKFMQSPCVIIEVLSASTEAYDRGRKFELYRQLQSLREYVLVGSESKTVEIFRQGNDGTWTFMAYGEGDMFSLTSVDVTVAVDVFYEDVVIAKETALGD